MSPRQDASDDGRVILGTLATSKRFLAGCLVDNEDQKLIVPTNRLERVRESLRKAFPLQVGDFHQGMKGFTDKLSDDQQ